MMKALIFTSISFQFVFALHVSPDHSIYSSLSGPTVSVPTRYSREQGLEIVNRFILPSAQYGDRIELGRQAQGLDASDLVTAQDPILSFSYGEFPTHSTDQLLDLALQYAKHQHDRPMELLDLGSGCGRLVSYWGLTRGTDDLPWHVHGVEISELLHHAAVRALQRGLADQHFVEKPSTQTVGQNNTITLHLGAAENVKPIIHQAQLIFAYSTTWDTVGFSQDEQAMILDRHWSELLATTCRKGCIVITTDRILDPLCGWRVVEKLDVDNAEVFGSTGYIQVLL
jgi:hypothetical protein